jgi:REP element-mobilizing transposase RayT
LSKHVPVHVTLRLAPGLPTLRQGRSHHALLRSLGAAADRHGLRILHYSAQSNHVHMVCEAEDARSVSRGLQGLCVRIAHALNQLWKRAGSVFADRFHCRQLKTPTEVRNALKYVLMNAAHHGIRCSGGIDSFSSGSWFDGWSRPTGTLELALRSCPFPRARTFLMTKGWRKRGLIDRPV